MNKKIQFILLGLPFIYICESAHAVGSGGYSNQVPHARAVGRANAVAATVNDSSAVTFNPSRIVNLRSNSEISIGATFQKFNTKYTSASGTSDAADHPAGTSPNFHLASKLGTDKWGMGLGVNVPHGLATTWNSDSSPLRFIATESDLAVFNINPTLAYEITEGLSLGIGLDYYHIPDVTLKKKMNVALLNTNLGFPDSSPEGTQELSGDGDDLGYDISASYSKDIHHFGVTFRKGASIEVEGEVKLKNLNGASAVVFGGSNYQSDVKAKVQVPDQLILGYGITPTENWTIELDAEWNSWSKVRDQNLMFSETDPTRLAVLNNGNPTAKDWKDSWAVSLGTEFQNNSWALRGGYGFFDTPIPNSTFEASTPDSDFHMLTAGAGKRFGTLSVDLALMVFFLNDRHINNKVGAVDGTTGNGVYQSSGHFLTLNFTYGF